MAFSFLLSGDDINYSPVSYLQGHSLTLNWVHTYSEDLESQELCVVGSQGWALLLYSTLCDKPVKWPPNFNIYSGRAATSMESPFHFAIVFTLQSLPIASATVLRQLILFGGTRGLQTHGHTARQASSWEQGHWKYILPCVESWFLVSWWSRIRFPKAPLAHHHWCWDYIWCIWGLSKYLLPSFSLLLVPLSLMEFFRQKPDRDSCIHFHENPQKKVGREKMHRLGQVRREVRQRCVSEKVWPTGTELRSICCNTVFVPPGGKGVGFCNPVPTVTDHGPWGGI